MTGDEVQNSQLRNFHKQKSQRPNRHALTDKTMCVLADSITALVRFEVENNV